MKENDSSLTAEDIQRLRNASGCFRAILGLAAEVGHFWSVINGGTGSISAVLNRTLPPKESSRSSQPQK